MNLWPHKLKESYCILRKPKFLEEFPWPNNEKKRFRNKKNWFGITTVIDEPASQTFSQTGFKICLGMGFHWYETWAGGANV
jgi:hypothetical protein